MSLTLEQRRMVTDVLNGVIVATKNVVPIQHEIGRPELMSEQLYITYGVLIGITGDMKGKLILSADDPTTFHAIGEAVLGMALANEMLESFSGELGNMIAGSLSTHIDQQGINIDITHPTILQGSTTVSGFKKAFKVSNIFESLGQLDIYLLLD